MADSEAVLFANEAFYRAFADCDFEAMEKVWAHGVAVTCIHPGWNALTGWEEVMESWQSILDGNAPAIRCINPFVIIRDDQAIVICYEDLGANHLVATNIFMRQGSVWKMIHHQAGPTATEVFEEDNDPAPVH